MAETRVGLILVAAIQKAGGDGLYNDDGECGCVLGDLAPGDCLDLRCKVGHRWRCAACGAFSVAAFAVANLNCFECGAEMKREAQNEPVE